MNCGDLVDLVGIEPTTSPATPGRASMHHLRRQSVLEQSGEISNSLGAFRVAEPQTKCRIAPDRQAPRVPGHALRSSVHAGVRVSERLDRPHNRYRTFYFFHSEECKSQAYGNLVDLVGIEPTTSSMPWKRAPSCATGPLQKNHSNRRSPRQGRGALPAAPQAHCFGGHDYELSVADNFKYSR